MQSRLAGRRDPRELVSLEPAILLSPLVWRPANVTRTIFPRPVRPQTRMATMKSAVQASHGVALRRPNSAARCLLAASSSQESLFRSVPQPLFLRISLVWFCFAHHVCFFPHKKEEEAAREDVRCLFSFRPKL